ncbi:oxidoreductase [Asanoa ishikariensis]|uniref:Glucose 1-dehydrogenase n=1 Tax=Asanoa ishikariensis TaxID=137265 RepID=A0A1H3P9I9_9ACTN|nr:SDR family oxidoreductase [Asanoa ishikariensis]GIF68001.1 oxidoreductase [Asanoa ishikariensis]SDY97782.1 glucose 1-dehydrogenase [Asanoa ishikariensis]
MKVTIVTGGSRGIGAATCLRLAAAGHAVAVGYRSDADAAAAVVDEIAASSGTARAIAVETADAAQVSKLFAEAAEVLGPVTGLVNNAGVGSRIGRFVDLDDEDLRRVVEVNVVGAIFCAREAARRMTSGGAIVNVSSAAATLGSPFEYPHYAASKAALDALTLGLSKELGPSGIRVNTVQPGIIYTDFHGTQSGEAGRPDRLGPGSPLGRAGQPDEVAAAIAWLLSDDASYVTGATIRVAGGR